MDPLILPRSKHTISRKNMTSATVKVLYRLKKKGYKAYLAGGGVRDLLLGREPNDFDVTTDATPKQIKKVFNNSRLIGRRFRLAHILFRGETIELSTFRAPSSVGRKKNLPGRTFKQKKGLVLRDNVFGTPEQDALRRDFTINALFYNIADFSVVDYAGGLDDLKKKIVRVIGDPDTRFTEDPVRMIRAVRFAGTLDFKIAGKTAASIKRNASKIEGASPPRLYDEILKLFLSGHSEKIFELLLEMNLLEHLFPEFGSWINDSEGEKKTPWLKKSFRQFDEWKASGTKIHPALMFALMFGPYHEKSAHKLAKNGLPENAALYKATRDHLTELKARVSMPKFQIARIAKLMESQSRFSSRSPKKVKRFMNQEGFLDAYLYFKFASKITGRQKELLKWWQARLK